MSYKEKAAEKIKERDSRFLKELLLSNDELPKDKDVSQFFKNTRHLSPKELEITESSTSQILSKIQNREWTSLEVTKSFAHRATIAHQLVNCLTEIFFEDAFQQAIELDEYLERTGEVKGPLHGLPVSFKDEFNINGQKSTIGLVSYIKDAPKDEDSPNVKILRDAGAVFYVKTNIPTGVFNTVTTNKVFGDTVNPFNRALASGGSSGGEGALVALKGSPLGVGSDIGGSIRQPSSFQNLFSIKPTSQRVPHDTTTILGGIESLRPTNGPLSTDPESLELYLKIIIDSKPWFTDSRVAPIPWNSEVNLKGKTLKFAILWDDGVIKPTAPIKRALEKVKEGLISEGHEIVEWDLTDVHEIAKYAGLMVSNGCKKLVEALIEAGEEHPGLEDFESTEDLPTSEVWKLQQERSTLVNDFFSKWNELGIDGLISPVSPMAGTRFDNFTDVSYSPLANVLDCPAATFPVLEVDSTKDAPVDIGEPRNEMEKKVHSKYDLNELKTCVVGLQVLGRRFEEEKTIQLVKVISSAIDTYDYWK